MVSLIDMVWLLVFVVCGAVVLLGAVWREISEHITLGDLKVSTEVGSTWGEGPMLRLLTSVPLITVHAFNNRYHRFITSRDAQRKARYSDRARPSVFLLVCLSVCPFLKRVSGSSYTVENASNAALIPTSPEMKPPLAAVGSATVAVLSQSSGIAAIFPMRRGHVV